MRKHVPQKIGWHRPGRAGADLAAALPKNEALHGPALAAFMNHPKGKRAAAAMGMELQRAAAARKAPVNKFVNVLTGTINA